jgi:hypothetical protein
MKRTARTLACLFISLAMWPGARATPVGPAANPYATITGRNIFHLVPDKHEAAEPPPRPVARITLDGTISLGSRRALLTAELPPNPPEPVRKVSLILAEGQEESNIRVLDINEMAGTVKVDNHGTVMVLTFSREPAKSSGPFAPAAPLKP